jgi:UDP-glucuronate decarboxylase
MSTILVTGAAGFLGSHLCNTLISQGNQVTGFDNLYTGSADNLHTIYNHPNFNFLIEDVRVPINLDNHFDEIYNLACPASPIYYQNSPLKTMQTCIYGAFNILEFAQKNNSKILQASTSEDYGNPLLHPQPERYWGNVNPIGIRSCYDEGKRAAESIFFDFYRSHKLAIKVVRIFNTFGPLMNPKDGRVVSNFIIQALQNEDITIYGDGKQTRSFCYVGDLIRGLIMMMKSDKSVTGPINLGTTFEFSMLELAQKIIQLTHSQSNIIFKPLPEDDPKERQPDLRLAKEKLNWEPQIPFEEGLLNTIEYFKGVLAV